MIAGFTLGAAGSLHCVGMCGPLSLALPVHHLSKTKKFFS
ncbi:MAG: sulfite exporter TauE/SafE family protein, partial [Chitinophagaceae bacterium]|nr:sulfite exporter TauE/SafE family protein [Chitinophagaceae bacterium]